eukprot:TRINITY_DN79992_c0_g1_i1.p1 TRINITY_DN79992_c0_g1~~TRINITY_DN79992_c0_g1_i1.p1  ORF type:complete len:295 (-),score=31.65 TRINITY_DN79992_c0_g1_i1:1-885(-)
MQRALRVGPLLRYCVELLCPLGVHAFDSAELLVGHAIGDSGGMRRGYLRCAARRPVSVKEFDKVLSFVRRAAAGEPVPYITGHAYFYGLTIAVCPKVLIPRPETEILVEIALEHLRCSSLPEPVVWDLCTGSGCVGIALAKGCNSLGKVPRLTLSDISPEALAVARLNVASHKVAAACKLSDIFSSFGDEERAHIIVANPPYIAADEVLRLDKSVQDYEPHLALVGGHRGTEIYERLAKELENRLLPGGIAAFEIGEDQGAVLFELFRTALTGWKCEIQKDFSNKDRFVVLRKL